MRDPHDRLRAAWRVGFVAFALVVTMAACAGSGESKSAPCERARDHLVELQLANTSGIDRAAHRDAMKRALGDHFVSQCTSSMGSAEVRCVLAARDSASAAKCATDSVGR